MGRTKGVYIHGLAQNAVCEQLRACKCHVSKSAGESLLSEYEHKLAFPQ